MELIARSVVPEADAGAGAAEDSAERPSATPVPPPPSGDPAATSPRPPSRLRRLTARALGHRLVQFGLVAAVMFAIAPAVQSPSHIELHHASLQSLHDAAARKASLTVLPASKSEEIDRRAVEDEILFREGIRLGLDQGDGVVRQRVIQKTLFLAEELSDASRPATEAELRAYFDAHAEDFAVPSRVLAQHVFASTREALPPRPPAEVGAPGQPPALGEPGPVPAEIRGDERVLTAGLGAEMARRVLELPVGSWEGPLRSPYGYHYVKVLRREGARPARFEEVRARVVEREGLDRRERAVADFLARAAARYSISLDGEAVKTVTPTGRVAIRAAASGED